MRKNLSIKKLQLIPDQEILNKTSDGFSIITAIIVAKVIKWLMAILGIGGIITYIILFFREITNIEGWGRFLLIGSAFSIFIYLILVLIPFHKANIIMQINDQVKSMNTWRSLSMIITFISFVCMTVAMLYKDNEKIISNIIVILLIASSIGIVSIGIAIDIKRKSYD